MAVFYYKVTFISCCDQTSVELQIQTSLVNTYLTQDGVYIYNGTSQDLITGQCYTYTVDTNVNVNGYNTVPDISEFVEAQGCEDPICQNCQGGCNCPPGFTPSPEGDTCIQIETISAISPSDPLFCGNNIGSDPAPGIVNFGSLNNYIWPLMTVPQASDPTSLLNMSTIPLSSNNPLTGDTWTNINPPPQGGGNHSAVTLPNFLRPYPSPNPLGLPVNTSSPFTTASYPYPVYQSTITSGTLNYGQGAEVSPLNYITVASFPLYSNYEYTKGVWNYQVGQQVQNQWAGFTACLQPETETTYQITIVGNNGLRIFVDDVLAVEMLNGDGATQALYLVNLFEITLPAGLHSVRVECFNYFGSGGLACDILECSYSQFTAMTTLSELEGYRVFSTYWKRARPMTLVSTGTDIVTISGGPTTQPYDLQGFFDSVGFPSSAYVIEVIDSTTYRFNQNIPAGNYSGNLRFLFTAASNPIHAFTCPDGYMLSTCDGISCVKTLETPCIESTYYTLNDCCTDDPWELNGSVAYLKYDGPADCFAPGTCPEDIGASIITSFTNESIGETVGCFKLTQIQELPPGAITSNYNTVIQEVETVATCNDCVKHYTLVFCDPTIPSLNTAVDLSSVVGQTILVVDPISGLEKCATVQQNSNCDNLVDVITQLATCTCQQCYVLTNCSVEGTEPIIVTNDLSQYVGKTIYLCPENFPTNPTPPTDPGVPYIIPNDQPLYFGTLTNCCDPTDKRYITNDFVSFPSTGVIVIPNIDSPTGASTTCWKYEKEQLQGESYFFADLTNALFYENCAVCNQQNPCVVYPIIEDCYCYNVTESQTCDAAITLTMPTSVEQFEECSLCLIAKEPKCYLLIDCSNPNNVIIVKNDFEAFVGKVIKTRYCDTCWQVLPAPSCVGSIPVEDAVASFDLCEDCLPPAPEPESNLRPRRIPPGYSTPGCSPEYTEKVDCNFADQAFDKMASIRYGINSCCEEDFDRWDIKKRLLDLKAIDTPTSELLPLQCKCYRIQVITGDVEFKYISCEGQVTYVTLGDTQVENLLIVCAQTYPRAVCPAVGTSYSIIMQNDCVNGQC